MPLHPRHALAALTFLVASASCLAPHVTSAQAEGETLAATGGEQGDESSQEQGLWTVRLEHSIRREYSPPNPLEEVTVRGRKPLSLYRRDIDTAEVGVWDAFNDANSDDQFDVTCRREAPLGTRIPQQVCRPRFLDEATSRAAGAMLQLDKSSSVGLQQTEAGRAHYLERRLGDELRGLAASEPDVQEQVAEYAETIEDYDEARSRPR